MNTCPVALNGHAEKGYARQLVCVDGYPLSVRGFDRPG